MQSELHIEEHLLPGPFLEKLWRRILAEELRMQASDLDFPELRVSNGRPLLEDLDEIGADDLVVMELSSFQLELMSLSPQVAVLLNMTPNHLDRHHTMDAYAAAKERILTFQSSDDTAVLGREDPGAWRLRSSVRGKLLSFGQR